VSRCTARTRHAPRMRDILSCLGRRFIAVANSSDGLGSNFHRWRESRERRFDGFASLVCSNALRMRIILDAFEHQSTNKPEHDGAVSVETSSVRQVRQGAPNDVQHYQGSFRHPTSNQSDKTLGRQYTRRRQLVSWLWENRKRLSSRIPLVRRHATRVL
jgi:hypothetical protein